MSDQQSTPKAIVREFFDAYQDQDPEAVRATLTEDFVHRNHPAVEPDGSWLYGDLDDIDRYLEVEFAYFNVFPDLEYELDIVLAEGNLVACRWTSTATHSGSWNGNGPESVMESVEPTGETVSFAGLNIFRIEDGKIAEMWGNHDDLGLFNWLGLIDIPPW